MVEMARDEVVIMDLAMFVHHMTIILDETGMVQGVHRRMYHQVLLHAVMGLFMVVINFIVVMVVEDDDRIAMIHVTREIVIGEKKNWNYIVIKSKRCLLRALLIRL